MKILKLSLICLITIISSNQIVKAQDSNKQFTDCLGIPGLSIIEITDQQVVHYLWSYEDTVSFYILEYKALDGCITLSFSEVGEPDFSEPGFGCPPDVWTEVPGPSFKTSSSNSTSNIYKSEFATAFFKYCVNFEFRMKVVCNSDTIYSNIVPYFYDDGNCPDCQPERTITENHNTDILIQAKNRIASNVVVEANVIYKAERVQLKSGFSSKPGYLFKVLTESCSGP